MAANTINQPEIRYHIGDLPDDVRFNGDIAIDTETSGQYPMQDDLCEIAAVKSGGGKIVDEFVADNVDTGNIAASPPNEG